MAAKTQARRKTSTARGGLPEWNLADLYRSPQDPAIKADLAWAAKRARAFEKKLQGKLAKLDGKALGAAIAEYEAIVERLYKLMSYAGLLSAAHVTDPKVSRFRQDMQERVSDISTTTLFFELEINKIPDNVLARQIKAPAAARYAPWLRDVRAFRAHQLADDIEKLLHEKSVSGRAAWNRLFDETMAGLRFPLGGDALPISELLNKMVDRKAATRKKAAKAFGKGLGENIRLFALITNTLAKDKAVEDDWRHYARPVSRRNLGNQVEDKVVEALVKSVKQSYPDLSHRYYKLKARWMGRKTLDYWDRNAPLPDAADRKYSWGEAKDMVLGAYGDFAPELSTIAGRFFDGRWIDAAPRPDKNSGAFSHSTVPSVHPYILMNFHGKARDVATLAHELGHGVHQVLAGPQGTLLADTPLTLAETASVFGEMLTFQAILKGETNAKRRRVLLAGKVEDMLNTVVRQIAFHEFERLVHDERRQGELTAERLGEIWMATQKESLGPAIRFDVEYRHYWSYIPHFVHSPFYVYAYAFGDCLVNSLYDVFRHGQPGFQQKYLEMLQAGGTKRHTELLAPFGLDAGNPAFWRRGLKVISGFIDEIEASF